MVILMVKSSKNLKAFLKDASNAANIICSWVKSEKNISVISHHDADGIAAAGIITQTLKRLDANFRVRIIKQIDEKTIRELSSENNNPIIFTDLGSSYIDLFKNYFTDTEIIILDHHPPVGDSFPNLIQVNPHLHGFEGSNEISGAGVAYFTAKDIDAKNQDLASLAVIGALGDLQDKNQDRKLLHLNELIVEDAIKIGSIKTEVDLVIFGRETKPVHKALANISTPFLPGISGEEDKCLGFLINLGINLKKDDEWITLSDLSLKEKRKIFSELVKHYSSKGLPSSIPMNLIGTVYTLINEDRLKPLRNAREYASLLNACGRMGKSGLGISICVGDRDRALAEAKELLEDYRQTIASYMNWLNETKSAITEMKYIYSINGGSYIDEKMLSTITSILTNSPFLKQEKPVIARTLSQDGYVKISGRTSDILTHKGIDLGDIMLKASEKYSGRGGGHNVAAGAQIPAKYQDSFIDFVDKLVGSSLDSK